jgi:hypothetical protein
MDNIELQKLDLSCEQLAEWKRQAELCLPLQRAVMPIFPGALIALIDEIERLREKIQPVPDWYA